MPQGKTKQNQKPKNQNNVEKKKITTRHSRTLKQMEHASIFFSKNKKFILEVLK